MDAIRPALRRSARLLVSALLVIGLVGLAEPPVAVAAEGRSTVTETLNVRSGPGTSYPLVGTLAGGSTVTTTGTSGTWTKITYQGRAAYVASAYLRAASAAVPTATVRAGSVQATTTAVNLRAGSSTSYRVLKVVSKGTRVTMTGRSTTRYAELYAAGTRGWASKRYLVASRGLPVVIGTRVATAALDIRTSSGAKARTVDEVPKGTVLSITGVVHKGRAQVVHARAARWVTARYLAQPKLGPGTGELPRVTGTRYATATLNIRSSSSDRYALITQVPLGTKLSITGVVRNERMQIVYGGAVRWVTARYLSRTRPSAAPPPGSSAVERGLTPNAIKVYREARVRFPSITTYYGVRPDSIPDHPSGRALDIMIPAYSTSSGRALGQEVANWAQANAGSLGIQYVIWNQRIWNVQRDAEGWRYMADRGGDSANHKNHVHVTVFG